ncbi:hypothetical protein [Paenibacillus physcomitrellae]|uniref:hypothetical protein n=1 Tax=Paenibacillus physcomitrellae TaxID=1619311 RepID=UPI00157F9E10|nr:hypothetical protein [Paenibacillus physcomitrellae]
MQKKIHTLKKVPFKVTLFSIREYRFKTVINYIHYTPSGRKKQTASAIQIFRTPYRLCKKGKNMPPAIQAAAFGTGGQPFCGFQTLTPLSLFRVTSMWEDMICSTTSLGP